MMDSIAEFRAAPPFARHVAIAAWFVLNPALPIGKKACKTCERPMRENDDHARCERCRRPDRHQYPLTCKQCGQIWLADKRSRQFCSRACHSEAMRVLG